MSRGSFVVGGFAFLSGALIIAMGGYSLRAIESDWLVEESSGTTLEILDEDGTGDLGYTFWVQGDGYVDSDDNNVWDHCDSVSISVISKPEVSFWSKEDGDFYYEVSDGFAGCIAKTDNVVGERGGLLKLGKACNGCFAGDFVFESNSSVWVSYDDLDGGDLLGGVSALIGGFALLSCGIIFLVIGLVLSFRIKKEETIVSGSGMMDDADGLSLLSNKNE